MALRGKAEDRPLRVAFVFNQARAAVAGMYEYLDRHTRWEVVHIASGPKALYDLKAQPKLDGFIASGWPRDEQLMRGGSRWWKRVFINCEPERGNNVVTVDEAAMARIALDEFAAMGLRRVAFYHYVPTPRGEAFLAEAQRRGIEATAFERRGNIEQFWHRRHEFAGAWLAKLPKPIGVFAHAHDGAQLLTAIAPRVNVHVPEQVAVLTCEAPADICMLSRPTLSCITGNEGKIGFEAARMLDRMFRGEEPDGPIVIAPTEVQRRGSTDILAVADADLARAIRLLRQGATGSQTIDDVLAQVPLSRNQLEHGMRKVLGRSPYEEVMRIRIETACRMLKETSLSMAEIGRHSGLGNVSNFCKIFKRKVGQSPRHYRVS